MGFYDLDLSDCGYDDKKSPAENHARAMFAIAKRLHNLSEAVEALGMNGAVRNAGSDHRGCLERLAVDLPEAVSRLADAVTER